MEVLECRYALATFTVINTNNSGAGSFRQAILDANATPVVDTINFSIGSGKKTITPTSALPTIVNPIIIDATTQPTFNGSPLIELNGTNAGSSTNGLVLQAANSTIRGLAINRFSGSGIVLQNAGTTANLIAGNFIGLDTAGTSALANNSNGISIIGGASSNSIGGASVEARNVISSNGGSGIYIGSAGTAENLVLGNFIGLSSAGTAALPNGGHGVLITTGASGTTIGGTAVGAANVISGNTEQGIYIDGTSQNQVLGNFIGTNGNGTIALPNGGHGILLNTGASSNTIGGVTAGASNVISGNGGNGIYINGSNQNAVLGNFIGTNAAGTAALANAAHDYPPVFVPG